MPSGSFTKTFGPSKKYKLQVSWTSTPDHVNNRAILRVKVRMYHPGSIHWSGKKPVRLVVDGVTRLNTTIAPFKASKKGWTNYFIDQTVYIDYGESSTKSIKIEALLDVNQSIKGKRYDNIWARQTCALGTVEKKSTLAIEGISSASIGDSINIKLQRSSSIVRHGIDLVVGSGVYPILTTANDVGGTEDSFYNYTIPDDALPFIPMQNYSCKLVCNTFIDGQSLGTTNVPINISPRATDVPVLNTENVSMTIIPLGSNSITDYYITDGHSSIELELSPTPSSSGYGDINIVKTQLVKSEGNVVVGEKTWRYADLEQNKIIWNLGEENSGIIDALSTGAYSILTSVTDRRNTTSEVIAEPINIVKYFTPYVDFSVARCTQGGELRDDGLYVKGAADLKFQNCNGLNSAEVKLYYLDTSISQNEYIDITSLATSSSNEWVLSESVLGLPIIPLTIEGGFSINATYKLMITVSDSLGGTGASIFQLGDENILASFEDSVVSFGKLPDHNNNSFEVAWDSYFDRNITCNGVINGTVQTVTSDARAKNIISDIIEDKLIDVWRELEFKMFIYVAGQAARDGRVQAGVIAQEVMAVFDRHGLNWKDYGIVYGNEESGFQVNYGFIYAISSLISQQHETKIDILTNKIDELEKSLKSAILGGGGYV